MTVGMESFNRTFAEQDINNLLCMPQVLADLTRFNLQSRIDRVATNPVLVKQVLVNLLKNAAEVVSDKGLTQLITRDGYSADSGCYIEIIVQDNGSGISPQRQQTLFKPVVSTKGVGHSGVGLSIVKGMVDDLGGRVSCHGSVESGTSFHFAEKIAYRSVYAS